VSAEVAEVMRQVRQCPVLVIEVVGDQDAAAKLLEGHKSIDKIERKEGKLFATLAEGVQDYSDLPTLLIQGGFKIKTFKEDEINLETAFMYLTKGITA
jgi:ABC-2 type transport system ATP-binding protein